MPSNKNHHFVPRVHLKPFSVQRTGKAINLINIDRSLLIRNASVSGQCSKAYYYGRTPAIEEGLAYFEGRYGEIVRLLEARENLSDDDMFALRVFVLFQLMRTEAMAKLGANAISGGMERAYAGEWAERRPKVPSREDVTMISLRTALRARGLTSDLKACIFVNETQRNFITSDNPAISMNRWYWQRQRYHNASLLSSGLILCLPLTPRLALCYFDSNTYSCEAHHPMFRRLTDVRDVQVLNELQILNADENIYFENWDAREAVLVDVTNWKHRRPVERVIFNVFVKDPTGPAGIAGGERYRRATDEELAQPIPKLVMHSLVYPVPSRWISCLRIRPRPRVFTNGSAAGYVRNSEWLTPEGRRRYGLDD